MTAKKTPRKTPAKRAAASRATRSTPKRARPYSPEQRAEALRLVKSQGIAHAHKVTEVPKPTLTRWAKAAGIDVGEGTRRRTAAATEAVVERATRARLSTVQLLEQHIERAGGYLSAIAGANADAAALIEALGPESITQAVGMAGPYAVVVDEDAQQAATKALALAGLPLAPRDAEGILTRAIHDLQLLRGEATERGELVVEFNVPRPNPATPVVEQDALGIEAP